jgi:hypothetical protein
MVKSETRKTIEYFRAHSSRMSPEDQAKASSISTGYFIWITGGMAVGAVSTFVAGWAGLNNVQSKGLRTSSRFLLLAIPITIAHDFYIERRAVPLLEELNKKYRQELE